MPSTQTRRTCSLAPTDGSCLESRSGSFFYLRPNETTFAFSFVLKAASVASAWVAYFTPGISLHTVMSTTIKQKENEAVPAPV